MADRRQVIEELGAGMLALLTGVTVLKQCSEPDRELVGVYRQWLDASANYDRCCNEAARLGTDEAERRMDAVFNARALLESKIHSIEAQGLAGAVVKLVLMLDIGSPDATGADLAKEAIKAINGVVRLPLP